MPTILDARNVELDKKRVFASRFKTDDFVIDSEINIHGNSSAEGLMWASLIVPVEVEGNLLSDRVLTQRNENASGAFVFYGPRQSSSNGDTPGLANGTENRSLIFLDTALHDALKSFETYRLPIEPIG